MALSADVANIWVTGLRYLLAHPSVIGAAGGGGVGSVGEAGGVAVDGTLGGKIRSEWLNAEFAQVDEDGYGIVSEDVAVATICKLCPGIKEAKVSGGGLIHVDINAAQGGRKTFLLVAFEDQI